MNDITLSVIVLTYNHGPFIRQAIESILMQKTAFPFEILVGDDGSQDGTRQILEELARAHPDRIRLFLRQQNLGAARNAYDLLTRARGRYLAFCEGDDYWTDENKLALQVRFLEEHPEFMGCTHRCRIVDEKGQDLPDQRLLWVKERERFTLEDFRGLYLPGQTATVVKRNIFLGKEDPYPFLYQMNRNISDRTSTLLYLSMGPFGRVPGCLSAYRQVTGITHQVYRQNPERILHELEFTDRLEELARHLTGRPGICRDYYRQLYAWAVWQWLKRPGPDTLPAVRATALRIGRGLCHPAAFVSGMLQKKGLL